MTGVQTCALPIFREMVGSSVGPTASESILNARRAKSEATRANTPDEFSTKTARVCLAMIKAPVNPNRAQFHARS